MVSGIGLVVAMSAAVHADPSPQWLDQAGPSVKEWSQESEGCSAGTGMLEGAAVLGALTLYLDMLKGPLTVAGVTDGRDYRSELRGLGSAAWSALRLGPSRW